MKARAQHAQTLGPQPALDSFAHNLGYRFTILTNQSGMTGRLDLTAPKVLPKGQWAIYMSLVEVIKSADSDAFDLKRINGDLYTLTPKAALQPGKTYSITLHGDGHFFSQYYVLPNAYVASDGLTARTIDASKSAIDPDSGLETLPFVAEMTDAAALQTEAAGDSTAMADARTRLRPDGQPQGRGYAGRDRRRAAASCPRRSAPHRSAALRST
ncbi:MAG: carbohydate-binding domain-containing protein [Asticcacaulis sp.]